MEKEKNFFLENELLQNTVLDVNSKEISGQIFLHNYSLISLSDHESDPEFLQLVLTNSDITKVLNVYLNFLEKRENEKFLNLIKHPKNCNSSNNHLIYKHKSKRRIIYEAGFR